MSVSNCWQQICCHRRNCNNCATTERQSETVDDGQQRHTNTYQEQPELESAWYQNRIDSNSQEYMYTSLCVGASV